MPLRHTLMTLLVALATTPSAAPALEGEAPSPVRTVASVELDRYLGLWHELARIPNRFQRQCVRGTTAEYSPRSDGRLDVVNRCVKQNGTLDEASGVARIVDSESRAKLAVSFVSFLGWRPFWGDYWIIGLDADYRWAIVGTPDRKYGWILARSRTLDDASLQEIDAILERNGYVREAFEHSPP